MTVLRGVGVSPGHAGAPVARVGRPPVLPAVRPPIAQPQVEIDRARAALLAVAADLETRAAKTELPEAAEILRATAMIARDTALADTAANAIRHDAQGLPAAWAVDAAIAEHRAVLTALGGHLGERASDLDDVRHRAVALLLGVAMPGVPERDHRFVLVADDLAPADTANLDPQRVAAIVTARGGPTSHTAILARALGLPAVVACAGADDLRDGDLVIVDGHAGTVLTGASEADVVGSALREAARRSAGARTTGPGRTRDGRPVKLLLNVGSVADAGALDTVGAEGIGLFRTELLYLGRPDAPGLSEQQKCYEELLRIARGRQLVVRTLDTGGDKPLAFLPRRGEANPALGVRGVRTARRNPEILDTQLRALAGAANAVGGCDLWVMAPMVATPDEAAEFATLAREHGLAAVGVMVEVPAAVISCANLLRAVDFISVGTNDLGQYAFAADRADGDLADLLDPWQPALLRLVQLATEAGADAGKPVGLCGEAAADPLLALVFAGLGVTSLSMAAGAVADVRSSLATVTAQQCRELAGLALGTTNAGSARSAVVAALRR